MEIIEDYIKTENTDNALLIDGEWGCGKTHYLKNVIKNNIESIKTPTCDNYKVIYISLNGLSKVNSISSEIIASSLGVNERGRLTKILYSSSDLIFNAASKLLKIDEYLEDKDKIDFAQFIDYKNKVLCFDDIERINSKLSIDEVLGYINTNFVEHNNIKVIIIGDVKKISEMAVFKERSEKIIGRKINFIYSYDDIFKIILDKYKSDPELSAFFNKNKPLIIALLDEYSLSNLRTIFFFTNLIQRYFNIKKDLEDSIWEKVLFFTLIITMEFKTGELVDRLAEKRKELWELTNNFILLDILRDHQDELEKIPQSYAEIFVKKYLMNYRGMYSFYSSIFNHISTGFLNTDEILREFEPSENKKYYDAFFQLNDYLILSEEDFKKKIDVVFEGLDKGIYNIYSHQSIFQRIYDFSKNGMITMSINEVKNKIFNSLEIAKQRKEDFDRDSLDRGDFYVLDYEDAKEVFVKIRELHDEYFHSIKKDEVLSILSKLDEKEASYTEIQHSFLGINFSDFFTAEECKNMFESSSNYSLTKFFRFLAEKYRYDDYKTTKDLTFVKDILKGLKTILEDNNIAAHKKAVLNDGLRILNSIDKELTIRDNK